MRTNMKQDPAETVQHLEQRKAALEETYRAQRGSIETAIRETYQTQIGDLSRKVLSILKEDKPDLQALDKPAYEGGVMVLQKKLEYDPKSPAIKDNKMVYFLHPLGPIVKVNEYEGAEECYRGENIVISEHLKK